MKPHRIFQKLIPIVLLMLVTCSSYSQSSGPDFKSPCGMTSAQFTYPPEPVGTDGTPTGYYNLDYFVTIQVEAPKYYWAHQYNFVGGETAYMGLQTAEDDNGEPTKLALFSIWGAKNAASAPNGSSGAFGHEGSGWSCRITYNWEVNRMYRIRVWNLGKDSSNEEDYWWGAWVQDTETGEEQFIGKILVPSTYKGIASSSLDFVEFYGNQDGQRYPCSSIEYTKSIYNFPTLNDGAVSPTNVSYEAYGECTTVAKIKATGSNTYQAETGLENQ